MKNKFYFLILTYIFAVPLLKGQTYFVENFNDASFLDEDSENFETLWSMYHANETVDINGNGVIDSVEQIKKNEIVDDPIKPSNKVLKMTFNRTDIHFFTQHKCSSNTIDNQNNLDSLADYFNEEEDAYCIDCSLSEYGESYTSKKNHMNRNELSTKNALFNRYDVDKPHFFGFKVLLPNDYQLDSNKNVEIIAQWHIDNGIDKGPPPASLTIYQGNWYVSIRPSSDSTTWSDYNLGAVELGQWTKWKFKVKYSSTKRSKFIVWKNGNRVMRYSSKTLQRSDPFYFKFGIYKGGWWSCGVNVHSNTDQKILYFDDVWANDKGKSNFLHLKPEHNYKLIDTKDMVLASREIPGYSYEFKFESPTFDTILSSNSYEIDLFGEEWLEAYTDYLVYIRIPTLNKYKNFNGPAGHFSTASLTNRVIPEDMNKDLSITDAKVRIYDVEGNYSYKFRIKNAYTGTIYFVDTPFPEIDFSEHSWVEPNTEYIILIRMPEHRYMNIYSKVAGYVYTDPSFFTAAFRPYNSDTADDNTASDTADMDDNKEPNISGMNTDELFIYRKFGNTYRYNIPEEEELASIQVINIAGAQIPIFLNGNEFTIDNNAIKGVYVVLIKTKSNKSLIKKLLLE